jgi:hypothetical protein
VGFDSICSDTVYGSIANGPRLCHSKNWLRSSEARTSGTWTQGKTARGRAVQSGKQFADSLQIEILENRTLLSSVTGKVLNAAVGDFNGSARDIADTNPNVDELNLTAVSGNLVVTLSKVSGAAKTNVLVSRTVGSTVNYGDVRAQRR